jgi:predicted esterase
MKHLTLLVLTLLIVSSCRHNPPSNYADFSSANVLTVANWSLIGPFSFDTLKQPTWETFQNEDLAPYGVDETQFVMGDVQVLVDSGLAIKRIEQPFGIHRLTYFCDEPLDDKSNYYLATVIHSPIEQEVFLMVDGAANYQVWLNQKEVAGELRKCHQRRLCNKFAKVQLIQGENVLFAKVNRGNNFVAWGLDVFMADERTAYEIFKTNYYEGFVLNPVFTDSLAFYTGPVSNPKVWLTDKEKEIRLDTKEVISGDMIVKSLGFLLDGFYELNVQVEEDTLSQLVYKGNIHKRIEVLREQGKTHPPREYQAVMRRVQFLLSHYDHSGRSEFTYHSINLVFWVHQLEILLNHPFRYAENLSIQEYQIPGDTVPKFYALSNSVKTSGTPLIVVLPYDIGEKDFLEGWYLGNYQQLFVDCRLAVDNGFAIAFLYGGGKQHTATDITNEFNQVMADIGQRYPAIDTSKVFLTGHCAGAAKAMLLASHFPSKVAALGVKSPMLYKGMEPTDLSSAKDVPFYIENGIYDTRIPPHKVQGLVENLRASGLKIEFVSLPQSHDSYRKDENRSIFGFFSKMYAKETHQPLP